MKAHSQAKCCPHVLPQQQVGTHAGDTPALLHRTAASQPASRLPQVPLAYNAGEPQQLAVGTLPPIASSSTASSPSGTDLVRAMPPCIGRCSSDVRRSLHGGGDASLSSLLPSAAPAAPQSCCHLRLLCWARTLLRLQGPLGGSMEPGAAAGQGSAVLAWPVQLSLRRLLRVLDRVHSAGLEEVGVPAEAATTIVPADPPLQLVTSSNCCWVPSGSQPQPQPPAAAGLGSCCCSPTTSWAGGCSGCTPLCCAAAAAAGAGATCCTAGCCCCCWSHACVRSCELAGWMGRGLRPSSLLRLTG